MVKQHLKIKQISFCLASEMLHFPSCNPPSFLEEKMSGSILLINILILTIIYILDFRGKKMKVRLDVVWILFISDFLVCLLYWTSLSWKDSSPFYSCVLGCQAFEWE